MPYYPFRYDQKEVKDAPLIKLSEKEEERRSRHFDEATKAKKYRDNNKDEWLTSMSLFNLTQSKTNDVITDFYLGSSRTFIDQSISMMTKAPPSFDFDPGLKDYKLAILYKALVEHVMSESDWTSQARKWMTDLHVMGPGVLHPFVRTPMRMDRWETPDGTIEEKVITDLRRQKVGIEHIHPLSCWRSCYDTSINDVTSGGQETVYTRAQFVQEFANVYLPSGKPKYSNISELLAMPGSHFKVTTLYHDVMNEYTLYALPYGSEVEGREPAMPKDELGFPILYKPLKRRRFVDAEGNETVSGHNVLGSVPLIYTGFADRYDAEGGSLSLYPMGLPKMIEGPETILDAMINMTLTNMRLADTVLISYKSYSGKTYPDLDAREYYSGQFIDGDINPQSLGVSRMGENSALFDYLKNVFTDLTGVNPAINSDDPASTAFEMAQKIRSNNARAEFRLQGMEVAIKRAGHMLLANCLSELTVPEWESITEEDAKRIADMINQGAMTADDFDPVKKKKRVQYTFPVKGRKFREDFSRTKTRKLDYTSDSNTLVEDKSMETETSYIPATKEYLLPSGDIQEVLRYGVKVEMGRMLGDRKAQDLEMHRMLLEQAIATMQPKDVIDRLFLQLVEYAQIDPRKIFGGDTNESDTLKLAKKVLEQLKVSPTLDAPAQTPQAPNEPLRATQPAVPNAGTFAAPAATPSAPSNSLSRYATGAM